MRQAVIVSYARTGLAKAARGGFNNTSNMTMLGHAIQHAHGYAPLVLRNAAVPAAQWGPGLSIALLIIGALMHSGPLVLAGLIAFSGLLFFQLVNLPVEFDASNRAKAVLARHGQIGVDYPVVSRHQGCSTTRETIDPRARTNNGMTFFL